MSGPAEASTSKFPIPPEPEAVKPIQAQPNVLPPPRRERSKLLRFLGINLKTLLEFAPSRKTAGYVALIASPVAFYAYDRQQAKRILNEYKGKVAHLADAPLPADDQGEDALLSWPKKIWIMTTRVPDDMEEDRASRWFKVYVKPVLYSAGYDYSFLNGTAPGALGRRIRDKVRLERIAQTTTHPMLIPGELGYLESLDKRRHAAGEGLTVLVGRNTLKEYFWGMKQGWLTDFDAVREEKGDEARTAELIAELAMDGRFDPDPLPEPSHPNIESENRDDGIPQPSHNTQSHQPSLFPPRANYSFFNHMQPSFTSTPLPAASPEPERSVPIHAVTEMPVQPPLLFLPFDHPLGYFRHWPAKMLRYLFAERYRVRAGCETALAIINATHLDAGLTLNNQDAFSAFEQDDAARGLRRIQPPRNVVQSSLHEADRVETLRMEDTVTENYKRLLSEYSGDDLPNTGSKDLDADVDAEWRYRKSFSDTPISLLKVRKDYYTTLPDRLATAREIAGGRPPTKEEGKYPPKTEPELIQERLNKEKKWRNDFAGWLMTRVGSSVTWDPRFENFRVLDLDMARARMAKRGKD